MSEVLQEKHERWALVERPRGHWRRFVCGDDNFPLLFDTRAQAEEKARSLLGEHGIDCHAVWVDVIVEYTV